NGEKLHLANVPFSLMAVRGGLRFLEQDRAAELIGACAEFIQKQMLEGVQMPSGQLLETLADALTSLEYYLEGGAVLRRDDSRVSVLDLAAERVRALGMRVAAWVSLRWQPARLDPTGDNGWALVHCQQGFLFDHRGVLFPRDWLKRLNLPLISEQGLGYFEGEPVFLFELAHQAEVPGASWQGLRQFMLQDEDVDRFRMLGFAAQIGTWVNQHRFCGRCGQPMRQHPSERAMQCSACGIHHYPRISPSMIVLVTRGDELLL